MKIFLPIASIIGIFIAFLALLAYNVATWAYVIVKTWNWFFVTVFSMTPLTFVQGVAISVAIGIIAARIHMVSNEMFDTESEVNKKYMWYKLAFFMITPWGTLLFAWITKLFFM
jgi:hypothetical protein